MKYTKSKPRMAFKFLLFPALAIFFFFAIPKPTSVIDLSSSNFDVILSHKPTLVFFTASYPSCHWCHEIDPYFEQIASNFAYASDKLTIAKINASKQPALARQLNITQYPSLRWFDGKTASPQDWRGLVDRKSLSWWIAYKTGLEPKAPSQTDALAGLTYYAIAVAFLLATLSMLTVAPVYVLRKVWNKLFGGRRSHPRFSSIGVGLLVILIMALDLYLVCLFDKAFYRDGRSKPLIAWKVGLVRTLWVIGTLETLLLAIICIPVECMARMVGREKRIRDGAWSHLPRYGEAKGKKSSSAPK